MTDKATRDSENILPHNPLKSRELFTEVKDKIKGTMSWLEFDLRCIDAYLARKGESNRAIADALTQLENAKTPPPAPAPAAKPQAKKETKATTATNTPGKADKDAPAPAPASAIALVPKKKRKTMAEIKEATAKQKIVVEAATPADEPTDATPPTTADVEELAEIKG